MSPEDWKEDRTASHTSLKLVGASWHGVLVGTKLAQSDRSRGMVVRGRTEELNTVEKITCKYSKPSSFILHIISPVNK